MERRRHRRQRLSQRRSRCPDASVGSAPGAPEPGRLHRLARPRDHGGARRRVPHAGVFTRAGDRHWRRHHRLDAAADRCEGAAAFDRSAIRGRPRRAGVALEGPHRRGGSGGDHRDRQTACAAIPRAYRRHLLVRVVVVEDLEMPEGRARGVRRGCELGRARRLRSRGARRRRRFARHRPLHLRGRPQGDVLRRVGRPAVEGFPRATRSQARRAARSPLRSRAAAGNSRRQPVPRVGGRARTSRRHRHRDGRIRRALRRGGVRDRSRHAGQDHRHVDVRLRDCADRRQGKPVANHPRHLRHRQRLDPAGLSRHRSGAVGRRRHPQLVGRSRLRHRRPESADMLAA